MCGFRVHAFVDVTCSSRHGLCVVTCSRIIVIYRVGNLIMSMQGGIGFVFCCHNQERRQR
jgi:hypothetical protein